MAKVVIVDYVRTPFAKAVDPTLGKRPGKLAHVEPLDMFVALVKKLMDRTGLNPKDVESVILGCVHEEAEHGLNPARLTVLHKECKLPLTVQGDTVDKFCGSSMRTIAIAKNDIMAGEADLIIAGGMQSMSRIPMGGWNFMINKNVYDGNPKNFMNMGLTAENLVEKYNISRDEQDDFSIDSHKKAADAHEKGYYKDEIVPIEGLDHDDCVRKDTNKAQTAKLKAAFKVTGSVTAASSSPVTDGASAVVLASDTYAQANNLPVLAEIVSYAGSGCEPEIMGIGPVEASKKALKRAGLTMNDIDVVEMNEAFAAQSIAVLKEMEKQGMEIPASKLNIDGGAIAIGHPLGASGARLVGHAAKTLQRTGKKYALATMCIGEGQGVAMIVKNPNAGNPAPKV